MTSDPVTAVLSVLRKRLAAEPKGTKLFCDTALIAALCDVALGVVVTRRELLSDGWTEEQIGDISRMADAFNALRRLEDVMREVET